MDLPKNYRFTKEHEWVFLDTDNIATVGITHFAQESLGDITYVQLPKEGELINKDDTFGVVESVKAVSDLFSPVTGRVVEINQPVLETPKIINEDPYNEGWLIKLEVKDENLSELDELMGTDEYATYLEEK